MNDELERFTDMILDYINYSYGARRKHSPVCSKYFEQESYQKWAINESIKYVFQHLEQSPLMSLIEFSDILTNYSDFDSDIIFSSAKEIVEDMIFSLYGSIDRPREFYVKGE